MDDENLAKCSCPSCLNHVAFSAEQAGVVIECPHCGEPFTLEENMPSSSSGVLNLSMLDSAFRGCVEPQEATVRYKLGVALVAAVMGLMVLLYLAMVIGAAGGMVYYAIHQHWMISGRHAGGILFWLFYLTPIIILLLLTVFLVKPLFARRAPPAASLALNPKVEPLLYGFIFKICQAVGAPMPARIYLDCHLNASAGFQREAAGSGKKELALTLGLPLLAGLTAQQFAGVVAHEFGHFTQKRTLLLLRVVWGIHGWFGRLAHERDSCDEYLGDWTDPDRNPWGTVFVAIARSGVTIVRLLIKALYHLGAAANCYLSRQMEFEADRYQYSVAGSAAFAESFRQMRYLERASKRAYEAFRSSYRQGKTPPVNFPAFVLEQVTRLDAYVRSRLEAAMVTDRTGVFDSHPSDGERLGRAREAMAPGLVELPGSATELLGNFDALAAQVTLLHYIEELKLPVGVGRIRLSLPVNSQGAI